MRIKIDEIIWLIFVLSSLVLYLLYLITIVRFRKVQPFNSPTNSISTSLCFATLPALVHLLWSGKFRIWGWFSTLFQPGSYEFLPKFAIFVQFFLLDVEFLSGVLLGLNGITGRIFVMTYKQVSWINI